MEVRKMPINKYEDKILTKISLDTGVPLKELKRLFRNTVRLYLKKTLDEHIGEYIDLWLMKKINKYMWE